MARMPERDGRIRLSAVMEAIARGEVAQQNFEDWFVSSASPGVSGGQLGVAFNTAKIDVSGLEDVARHAAATAAVSAQHAIRVASTASGPGSNLGTILAEGDSWFNLPKIIWPDTLVDRLPPDWRIDNIAHYGDTLDGMIQAAEYLGRLKPDTKVFMFSAGGNDMVGAGNVASYLRQRVSGDNDPHNASRYIRPAFSAKIREVKSKIEFLISQIGRHFPQTHIFMHGYDYPIPVRNGEHLGDGFTFRGFDLIEQGPMVKAIMKIMTDTFSDMLISLDRANLHFHHVDLRGTVKAARWWDELHATSKAAADLSLKYQAAIRKVFP